MCYDDNFVQPITEKFFFSPVNVMAHTIIM